jgi:hypothetical protein
MKILSIEEKAKRYDEALAMAKECITYIPDEAVNKYMLNMFPELKESEDEKIRKELIRAFKSMNSIKVWNGIERTNILAWLEKQGEHHIVCSEEQMKVLDEVLNFAANHESPYWNYYIFGTLNNLIRQFKTESIKL